MSKKSFLDIFSSRCLPLSVLRFNLLISTLVLKTWDKVTKEHFYSKELQLGYCPHYRSFLWEDKSLVETGKESKHTQPTRISQFTLRTIYKLFDHCRWPCKLSDDVWGQLIFEAKTASLFAEDAEAVIRADSSLSFPFESEDKMRMNIYVNTKSSFLQLLFLLILTMQSLTFYKVTKSLHQSLWRRKRQFSQLLSKYSSFPRIWQSLTSGTSFWWKSQQSLLLHNNLFCFKMFHIMK